MTRTTLFFAAAALFALAALFPAAPPDSQVPAPPPVVTAAPAANLLPERVTVNGVTLAAKLGQRAIAQSAPSSLFATVELSASSELPRRPRGKVSLALVIDRSGSMAGQKLFDARRAALKLIDSLEDGDRLAIVHYGSDVTTFPSLELNAETRGVLRAQVQGIGENGGTNISSALVAGAEVLRAQGGDFTARRIILLSDGQPTEGVTSTPALLQLASDLRAQSGVAVSALGVGTDFNDQLMRGLANHGGGFYAFLPNAAELEPILQQELAQAVTAVARQVEVRLQPSPGTTIQEVFGFPWRREADGTAVVQVYDLSAGKTAKILTELTVAPGSAQAVMLAGLSFTAAGSSERVSGARLLSADRTDDAARIAHGQDVQVHADSLRVLGGRQIAEATREFERGNRTRALSLFGNVRSLFGTSAQALAGEIDALDRAEKDLLAAPPQAVTGQGMQIRKNLSNFGVNNAY